MSRLFIVNRTWISMVCNWIYSAGDRYKRQSLLLVQLKLEMASQTLRVILTLTECPGSMIPTWGVTRQLSGLEQMSLKLQGLGLLCGRNRRESACEVWVSVKMMLAGVTSRELLDYRLCILYYYYEQMNGNRGRNRLRIDHALLLIISVSMPSQTINISGTKYHIQYKIGKGQQGIVYCVNNPKGDLFALKVMDILNDDFRDRIYKEITLHTSCHCDSIIKLIDSQEIDGQLYVVLELGECNLTTYLETKQNKSLDEKEIVMLIKDMAAGLVEVHNNDIIHRDIKADNIILKENRFKISDFGVSGEGISKKTFIGTPIYLAPEMMNNQFSNDSAYNFLVDVWALGVIAFEAFFAVHPFYSNPAYKNQMNFEYMKSSFRQLIPEKGFSIQGLMNKLKAEGQDQKVAFIEKKIKETSPSIMLTLRIFWAQVLTLDPSRRINARAIYKMFEFSNRTSLFDEPKVDHAKGSNPNTHSLYPSTHSLYPSTPTIKSSHNLGFGVVSPAGSLQKANSFKGDALTKKVSMTEEKRPRHLSLSVLNQEQFPQTTKISLTDLSIFIQNTKTLLLHNSSSLNIFMNIKQLQSLNPCLIGLEMSLIYHTNTGTLPPGINQKFSKLSRAQKLKNIQQPLHQASSMFMQFLKQYPYMHMVAQVILRLQIVSAMPKIVGNWGRFTGQLAELFPLGKSLGELEQTMQMVHADNLNYFLTKLNKM